MITSGAIAQDGGGQGGGGQGGNQSGGQRGQGGGQGRRWDPAEMQNQILKGIKDQLKAPDDEWNVIEPKLKKVFEAQMNARTGMFGGGRGGRGGGGGGDNAPTTEIGKAAQDLRTLLQSDNPPADQVTAKLAAYRAARDKANAELKTAREALKEVLTEKQEALLVVNSILE
jgi:hypothetical protein